MFWGCGEVGEREAGGEGGGAGRVLGEEEGHKEAYPSRKCHLSIVFSCKKSAIKLLLWVNQPPHLGFGALIYIKLMNGE